MDSRQSQPDLDREDDDVTAKTTRPIWSVANVEGMMDVPSWRLRRKWWRFLHHKLSTHVFTPGLVVSVLISLRSILFPNNSPGPPAPPAPSLEEQIEIRRRAAKSILSLIPTPITYKYFSSHDEEDALQQIDEDILAAFGDKYLNKHLVYGILELILLRLVPELQEAGVGELLSERGINWGEVERQDANVVESDKTDVDANTD